MAGSSAWTSTSAMLAEVGCLTGAELVTEVRKVNKPVGPVFIDSLDHALQRARPHQGGSTLLGGDLVEVTGASGSGKTTLLSFILATSLLPRVTDLPLPPPGQHRVPLELGGKAHHAVLLQPSTHRPLVPLIAATMRDHVRSSALDSLKTHLRARVITPALALWIDGVVAESLGRLTVIRPRPRWRSWAMALHTVLRPPGLRTDPGRWAEKDVSLVVCDGLGDGFYPDKWAAENRETKRRTSSGGGAASTKVRQAEDVGLKDVMDLIWRIRQDLGAVVVLSVQGLRVSPSALFFTSHLGYPYPAPFSPESVLNDSIHSTVQPLNIQITLQGRVRGLQFPADTLLADALRVKSEAERDEAALYEGTVRVPGGQGYGGTQAGEKFTFRIGPSGLEIHPESI